MRRMMMSTLERFCVHCGENYTAPNDDTVICYQCWCLGVVNPPPLPVVVENGFDAFTRDVIDGVSILFRKSEKEKQAEKDAEEMKKSGGLGLGHPCVFVWLARMIIGFP
jgi:hypothetical protein